MAFRSLLRWTAPLLVAAVSLHASAQKTLRIGFQKSASLLTLQKSSGSLEKKLGTLGVAVKWVEFPAGPQLLEALALGSVELGATGDAPPVFAQAAGKDTVYVADAVGTSIKKA